MPAWLKALGVLWALLALGVMLTFWQGPFLFTLVSAFRLHLVLALLLVGLPMTAFFPGPRRWVFLALPLAVTVTFASYFVSGSDAPPPGSTPMRVAVSNVLSANHDLSRLAAWVGQEKPDLLALIEVAESQRAQLESLPYEYKYLHPRASNFGLGLLCRQAPSQVVVLDENTPFPSLLASWPDYRVLVTHPMPPISRQARAGGDEQIKRLLSGLREGPPLLVLGDLNATGWDLRLRPLTEAGMVEARRGHGFLPTWPVGAPVFGIPIDHVYLPSGWVSLDCRTGPDIGSDHYPLVCDLARLQ